jgi:hypothetical protein
MPIITHECLVCDTLLEAERSQIAIHRLNALIYDRGFPYVTPLKPSDRVGPDDGSTVEVKRHVRPFRLADGKFVVPITPRVRELLTSGRLAGVTDLTAAQRTRLLAIWAARRTVSDNELSEDQDGLDA